MGQSAKPLIDEFLAGLHVECPRLGFRDVVDEAQVGTPASLWGWGLDCGRGAATGC